MNSIRILLSALLLWGFAASAKAATEQPDSMSSDRPEILRPVFAAYTVEAGSGHLADTYLSPIKYSGWNVGLSYQRLQAMKFSPEKWVQQFKFGIYGGRTLNQVGNAAMWNVGLDLSWGMMRRWQLPQGFSVGVGGEASLDLGCLYLSRNGNNPASAKAAITLNATGYAAWNGSIGRLPLTIRYQPSLPVIGAFFSPDYGELYYEIYLGNHSGLAHCAWWGNYFRLDQALTVDLHFGATALRLGYSSGIFSSKVNDLVTRQFTHMAVIGVSGEWLSYNPCRPLSKAARTISATY